MEKIWVVMWRLGMGPVALRVAHLLGMEGLSPAGKQREQSGPRAPGLGWESRVTA